MLPFPNFKIALKNMPMIAWNKSFEGTEQLKDLRKSDIKVVLNTGYDSKTA
jgi:hypothetical protein